MDGTNMTEGVVSSKVDEIIEQIKLELVTNATAALKDNESIKTSLRESWSGADCEAFITNFDKAVEATCQQLEEYENQIRTTLNTIPQQWSDFQNKNVISN